MGQGQKVKPTTIASEPDLLGRTRGVRGDGARSPKARGSDPPVIIGWKEYVDLPLWRIRHLKVKMDTGARTSAIHASKVRKISARKLSLILHPHRKKSQKTFQIVAPVTGYKWVTDSGGHLEKRPVIQTWIVLGKKRKKIELTVTNRDNMLFRLILGRKALEKDFVVDPSKKYLMGKGQTRNSKHEIRRKSE